MSGTALEFSDPANKERLLEVLRQEISDMFALAAHEARWEAPTACVGWEVRDVIGHLVHATEGDLTCFDIALSGATAPAPLGMRAMAQREDDGVRALRTVARGDLLERLRVAADRMVGALDALSDAAWSTLMVPHGT